MSNALRIGNRSISYEQAKEMLFPELIPQKGNEAMLSTVPHEKVEDMAVVFRLDLHSESGMMMSTRVNQAILDGFGVTADQIKLPILRFFILRIDYPTLLVAFGLRPRFFGLYFLLHCSFAVLVIHSVGGVIPKASQILICSELNVVI